MRLQNKVAIITGADSGIGQAIALQMAREGAAVTTSLIERRSSTMAASGSCMGRAARPAKRSGRCWSYQGR